MHDQILASNAKLVAISPIEKRFSRKLAEKLGLDFPILGDPGNRVANQFELVVRIPEELLETYRGFGVDFERINGDASGTLPMPARYIVGTDGIIRHADVNLDHTCRPEPAETVAHLKALNN